MIGMNKIFRIYCVLGFLGLWMMASCADDESFSSSKADLLSFSTDTVKLDTTFSNVPTPTKTMWVYNRTNKGLRCSNIRLEQGNQNGFRVNVDGTYLGQTSGYQTRDVEIRKGDSIRVFVELTSPKQQSNEPQKVEDNLVFTLESGVQQKLALHAVTWDADLKENGVEVKSGEEVVLGEKDEEGYQMPIVIYGGIKVAEGGTLRLPAGATIYFHENAGIEVAGKLLIEGTAEEEVTLRGDRIDHMFDYLPYDRTPGQWQGITLKPSSHNNEFSFADIHSAYNGVMIEADENVGEEVNENEGEDVGEQPLVQKLSMKNSTIHNCQGYGMSVKYAKVQLENCQISNTLKNCLYVLGSDVEVNNCTFAQFYPFDGNRGSAIGFMAPMEKLDVKNSLVTGYADDEVVWTPVDGKPLNFTFDHCVLRTEEMTSDEYKDKFTKIVYEDVKDEEKKFGENHFRLLDTDNLIYDFRLSKTSAAIGTADPITALPADRYDKPRDKEKPDVGCFQHQEEEKVEE